MYEHLGKCLEVAKKRAAWLLKVEGEPFTVNNHYLADYKEKFLAHYRRARRDAKRKATLYKSRSTVNILPASIGEPSKDVGDPVTEALTALSRAGYTGLTKEDLPKLLGQDAMEPALEIMAMVRAYFQGTLAYS
jgi:hypothetical protein